MKSVRWRAILKAEGYKEERIFGRGLYYHPSKGFKYSYDFKEKYKNVHKLDTNFKNF